MSSQPTVSTKAGGSTPALGLFMARLGKLGSQLGMPWANVEMTSSAIRAVSRSDIWLPVLGEDVD